VSIVGIFLFTQIEGKQGISAPLRTALPLPLSRRSDGGRRTDLGCSSMGVISRIIPVRRSETVEAEVSAGVISSCNLSNAMIGLTW
jgi:hypothetical protein